MKKPRLNEYISLQVPTEDYSTGTLVVTNTTVMNFWGSVKEIKSPSVLAQGIAEDYTESRQRDTSILEITCRTRDTESVLIGSELTFDSIDGTYQVYDSYDVEFKHYRIIMAQKTN